MSGDFTEDSHSSDMPETIPLFLSKTFEFVSDEDCDEIVAWALDGRGFIVKDVSRFCDLILTKYFRHCNFSSFTRQLNMYDFKKSKNEENEKVFAQPYFQRGKRALLSKIQRKKVQPER